MSICIIVLVPCQDILIIMVFLLFKSSSTTTTKKRKEEEDDGPAVVYKAGKDQRIKDEKSLKVLDKFCIVTHM